MPYLMGGFPDVETSVRIAIAYADNGADLIELGVPFSTPGRWPVIHAAATAALEAGANVHQILEAGARIAEHVPVVLMCLREPDPRPRARALRRDARRARHQRPDRARSPARGVRAVPRRVRRARRRARPARRTDHSGQPSGRDWTDCAWICLHGFGDRHDRRAGGPDQPTSRRCWRGSSAHSPVPVALGFGISDGAQAAAAADAGADGVIVGSRLVRAVAEAAERGRGSRRGRPVPWSRS